MNRKNRTWNMAAAVFGGPTKEQELKMQEAEKKEQELIATFDHTPKCRVPEQGFCNSHDCPTHHGEWHEGEKVNR